MTIQQFLAELRDTAMEDDAWYLDSSDAIRRSHPRPDAELGEDDPYWECPIVAMANNHAGEWGCFSLEEWAEAAEFIGLRSDTAKRIADAADVILSYSQSTTKMRKRLTVALGLDGTA